MELFDRMDAMLDEGHSREVVLKFFEKEIEALARAEYMRQCHLSSLPDEELNELERMQSTDVCRWLESE